ncbi:MAG: aminopeptidase, partial [Intestinibacter sp.]|uniref:aminopeptidase n=1 Tax=Intestinibacter sp. TaxID=1965304 RepID=UPI003F18B52D
MDLETRKNEYAELIVKAGIQLKPGEKVIINSDVTIYDMTRRVCEICYQEGASYVEIRWSDSRKEAMDFKYADEELLIKVDKWQEEQYIQQSEELPCLIHLLISDSIPYSEIMQERQAKARVSKLNVLSPYIQKMQNKYKWTAVCIPTQVWADQVFPSEENNLEHLWEDVLHTLMITGDGQSIKKWDNKWHNMWDHMDRINALGLKSLHLESELGTNLTVALHPKVKFACASGR